MSLVNFRKYDLLRVKFGSYGKLFRIKFLIFGPGRYFFELAIVVNLAKSFRPYGQEVLD